MTRFPRLPAGRVTVAAIATSAVLVVGLVAGLLRLLPIGSKDTGAPRLVFAAFGQTSDLIYVAPATTPDDRSVVDTVHHAEGWGLNPSAMSGNRLAYIVIPSGTPAQRGAPAELWLLDVRTHEKTRLARDADLLVKPLFLPGGTAILYRRTDGDLQSIVRVEIDTQVRTVVHEERTAFGIFPIGLDASGRTLFARLSNTGTDVLAKRGTDAPGLAFHASDEIARDWQLSPDRRSLSYLAPISSAERVVYRAHVVAIESGRTVTLPELAKGEQYGPTWTPDGVDLAVGQEPGTANAGAVALLRPGATPTTLRAPERGFDVPVAWSAGATYLAARTFDGKNSTAAGRESAVVIAKSGERYPVSAPGEVILVGWLPNA